MTNPHDPPLSETRGTDTLTRTAVHPMKVEHLRVLGEPAEMSQQYHAHLLALVEFHRSNGTRLDDDGRLILRASAQRKADRRVASIREIQTMIPRAPKSLTLAEAHLRLATTN